LKSLWLLSRRLDTAPARGALNGFLFRSSSMIGYTYILPDARVTIITTVLRGAGHPNGSPAALQQDHGGPLLPPGSVLGAGVLPLAPAPSWALSGAPGREDHRLRQRPGSQGGEVSHCMLPFGPPALQQDHGGPCCLPALTGALGPSSGSGYTLGPLRGPWP